MDLIRGIWDVFKNELRFAATLTAAFTTRLNGQLAGRRASRRAGTGLVRPLNAPSST